MYYCVYFAIFMYYCVYPIPDQKKYTVVILNLCTKSFFFSSLFFSQTSENEKGQLGHGYVNNIPRVTVKPNVITIQSDPPQTIQDPESTEITDDTDDSGNHYELIDPKDMDPSPRTTRLASTPNQSMDDTSHKLRRFASDASEYWETRSVGPGTREKEATKSDNLKSPSGEGYVSMSGQQEKKTQYSDYVSASEVPQKINVKDMSVKEVTDCLQVLKMSSYVEKFEDKDIDGELLYDILESEDFVKIFEDDFGFSKLDAMRLKKFFVQGWRPKQK